METCALCCEECRYSLLRLKYQKYRFPALVQGLSLCNRRPRLRSSFRCYPFHSRRQYLAPLRTFFTAQSLLRGMT